MRVPVTRALKEKVRKLPGVKNLLPWEGIGRFKAELDDVKGRIGETDLEKIFLAHEGPRLNKWIHYLAIYDRHLSPYRNGFSDRPLRFLEIGVFGGGSLKMWRSFFGSDAVIYGVDINPYCAQFDGHHGQVRIGSQDDPEFLANVVKEMGGVDVVLDDGSHMQPHVQASFEILFPLLSPGGVYMIEDLHTAYWPSFGGGYHAAGSFIETAKLVVDDMHRWYHKDGVSHAPSRDLVTGVHFHDSLIVLDKAKVPSPVHVIVGTED